MGRYGERWGEMGRWGEDAWPAARAPVAIDGLHMDAVSGEDVHAPLVPAAEVAAALKLRA